MASDGQKPVRVNLMFKITCQLPIDQVDGSLISNTLDIFNQFLYKVKNRLQKCIWKVPHLKISFYLSGMFEKNFVSLLFASKCWVKLQFTPCKLTCYPWTWADFWPVAKHAKFTEIRDFNVLTSNQNLTISLVCKILISCKLLSQFCNQRFVIGFSFRDWQPSLSNAIFKKLFGSD